MARATLPPLRKIPDGATIEDKIRMLEEHRAELVRLNPGHFNPDGSQKSLWQHLKSLFS